MIEFIGGLMAMVLAYSSTVFVIGFVALLSVHFFIKFVNDLTEDDRTFVDGFCDGFAKFFHMTGRDDDIFSLTMLWLGVASAIFYVIYLFPAFKYGFTSTEALVVLLWPYAIGAWASVVLTPVGIFLIALFGSRAVVRASKKVVKLKDALASHMTDKGAHE